jgi:hypothetical protein
MRLMAYPRGVPMAEYKSIAKLMLPRSSYRLNSSIYLTGIDFKCPYSNRPLKPLIYMSSAIDFCSADGAHTRNQVVMAPIAAGLILNTLAPKFCRAVEPICPVVGVIATVVLVGADDH